MRDRIQPASEALAPSANVRPRTIALKGIAEFPFETHGRRDGHVSYSIDRWGLWEPTTTALLLELLRNDADMIDVGANIGWHSVVAAQRLGARGRVHSFEPEPRNLQKLRRNIQLSGLDNVVVNPWALANAARTGRLYLSEDNFGDHRLGHQHPGRDSLQVEIRRLDDYDGIGERPLVIKLDVQGSEWHVLDGARRLLERHPHEIVMLCEMTPAMLLGCGATVDALIDLLAGAGFVAAIADQKTRGILPLSWQSLRARMRAGYESDPDWAEDIVAFRRPDGLMSSVFAPRQVNG